jgi:hypothetical protein
MAKNIPLTPKEKVILLSLVKSFSLDVLKNDLMKSVELIDTELFTSVLKMYGIDRSEYRQLAIQYLKCAVDNYDLIGENKFPDKIERCQKTQYHATQDEVEFKTNFMVVERVTLPSMMDEINEEMENHWWDYDPDTVDTEYHDSEYSNFEFNSQETISFEVNVIT